MSGAGAAAPGGGIRRALGTLDDAAERALSRYRGRRGLDTAALVVSNLADYGFVWAVVGAAKARLPGPSRRRALLALALSGTASAAVNTSVKRIARRQRPDGAVDPPAGARLRVRPPASSSFPSGHTLAAFCTAVTLPEGGVGTAFAVVLATAVAASRVHLRAHHASDVVGGAAIGLGVGLVVRSVLELATGE